ncbi:MAG: polyphosphate kinase 1 [Tannerella sp.]|jgi:polyphosphate kinase|nr:polyphosphate kinase 1 [Tannerella sp.]
MTDKTTYEYFKRDMSWLSFNYRVLLEASDETLPIYERIRFLSIYSSNTEEFYEIRVAEHRTAIQKKNFSDGSAEQIEKTLEEITREVNRQQEEFYRIFYEGILPELQRNNIYLYCDHRPQTFHRDFVSNYFREYVFPFLSPVTMLDGIDAFIRDRRLYLAVRIRGKRTPESHCVLIKLPYDKVPRIIPLPPHGDVYYYMFVDDMIRANLSSVFTDYTICDNYAIKISRDADFYLDDMNPENMLHSAIEKDPEKMLRTVREKLEKRKVGGEISRFMYDRDMPVDLLNFICRKFHIKNEDLVKGGRYMNLQDLSKLPNPFGDSLRVHFPTPMHIPRLDSAGSVLREVESRDILLLFPYQKFDYLTDFMREAVYDPDVEEIKITQYRVAENSAVIDLLVKAAENGKRVTVFVEVKARFDEAHNISTAEWMNHKGIRIIYSSPSLKIHAKAMIIRRRQTEKADFAYVSTGNFNEKTARIYSDMALLTCNSEIVDDINILFNMLEKPQERPLFRHLLVARFNMVAELKRMIRREIMHVEAGRKGQIILKMNGLQDENMIDELYGASESGVDIDLIVRGICCLIPNRPYSRNIRVTRIVDMFLEHARVWYFYNDGAEDVYISSADWMKRNLNRRIEAAVPVLDSDIRQTIIDILQIQLHDNTKACFIDEHLQNVFKCHHTDNPPVRAQTAIREYVRGKCEEPPPECRGSEYATPADRDC